MAHASPFILLVTRHAQEKHAFPASYCELDVLCDGSVDKNLIHLGNPFVPEKLMRLYLWTVPH